MAGGELEITEASYGNVTVLTLGGRLDSPTAPKLEKRILDLLGKGVAFLVVEMGGLDLLTSAGIRVLLFAAKRLAGPDRGLVLCNLRPNVRTILDVAGLLAIFDVQASQPDAVASLAQRAKATRIVGLAAHLLQTKTPPTGEKRPARTPARAEVSEYATELLKKKQPGPGKGKKR